jgi:queuine tRNA-ribosyltransferase
MLKEITIKGKTLSFPTFFPDATRGVVRNLDQRDVKEAGIEGMVVNTYHLMTDPGGSVLRKAGGLKAFMNWDGFFISDSGGFQVFSIIQNNKAFGSIDDKGVTFKEKGKSIRFTPEKSIKMQFDIGADIMICFDECPSPNATVDEVKAAVDHTIQWAKKCRIEFDSQIKQRGLDETNRPLLFGVVQGGDSYAERERCTLELEKIGFDGYGFGGWPLDNDRNVNYETLKMTAELMPDDKPKYALGLGNPEAVMRCREFGYDIFDCVLPTRDARHQRLYNFQLDPSDNDMFNVPKVVEYLYIKENKYRRDKAPISKYCECRACKEYSRSYIHHLFNVGDNSALRLATIHNLRYYSDLTQYLRVSEKQHS